MRDELARVSPATACQLLVQRGWLSSSMLGPLPQDQPVIQHGHVVLTDKPGIGLDVNDEVARHYVRPGTEYFGDRP